MCWKVVISKRKQDTSGVVLLINWVYILEEMRIGPKADRKKGKKERQGWCD